MTFSTSKYLKRINYDGSLEVCLKTLKQIHKSHLYNIPFENLDVMNQTPIVLEKNSLYNKIVTNNRGGFCYELNGLFFYLLQSLGFKVSIIEARVFDENEIPGQAMGHLALYVKLDKEYLVDVGFGDSFINPLIIENDIIQKDESGYYCIQQYDQKHYVLKRSNDKRNFVKKYIFTLKQREFKEFYEACSYTSTSEKSKFTQKKIISIPIDNGRYTLLENNFIEQKNGIRKETTITEESAIKSILFNKFGLKSDWS